MLPTCRAGVCVPLVTRRATRPRIPPQANFCFPLPASGDPAVQGVQVLVLRAHEIGLAPCFFLGVGVPLSTRCRVLM